MRPFGRSITGVTALLRPNVGRPDHLGPLLDFVGDKLAEVRRRACEYRAAEVSDPLGLASEHPGTRPPRSSTHKEINAALANPKMKAPATLPASLSMPESKTGASAYRY